MSDLHRPEPSEAVRMYVIAAIKKKIRSRLLPKTKKKIVLDPERNARSVLVFSPTRLLTLPLPLQPLPSSPPPPPPNEIISESPLPRAKLSQSRLQRFMYILFSVAASRSRISSYEYSHPCRRTVSICVTDDHSITLCL